MGFVGRIRQGIRSVIGTRTAPVHAPTASERTYSRRGVLALSGKLILGGAAAAFAGPLAGCETTGGLQCGDSLNLFSEQIRSLLANGVGLRFAGGRMVYEASTVIQGRDMGIGGLPISIRLGLRPGELGFDAEGRFVREDDGYTACAGTAVAGCSPYAGMDRTGLAIVGVRATAFDRPLVRERKADGTPGMWAMYDVPKSYAEIPGVDVAGSNPARPVLQERSGQRRYMVEALIGEGETSRPGYFEVERLDLDGPLVVREGSVAELTDVNPADLTEVQAIYGLKEPAYGPEGASFEYMSVNIAGHPRPNQDGDLNDISDQRIVYVPLSRNDLYSNPTDSHAASMQDVIDGNPERGIEGQGLEWVDSQIIALKGTIELTDLRSGRTTHAVVEISDLQRLEYDPIDGTPNLPPITTGTNPETGEAVLLSKFFDGGGPNFRITIRVEPGSGSGTPNDFYTWMTALGGLMRIEPGMEGCL